VPRNTVKTLELISRYAEDNEIVRPEDLVVKSTGVNSVNKLYIIQNIDRKIIQMILPLPRINMMLC
jgi:hypothetical protein